MITITTTIIKVEVHKRYLCLVLAPLALELVLV